MSLNCEGIQQLGALMWRIPAATNVHGNVPPRKMKPLFHRNVHGNVPPRTMKPLFHRNVHGKVTPRTMKPLFHRNVHGKVPPRKMKPLFHLNTRAIAHRTPGGASRQRTPRSHP
jgi:hypothetical protein